MRKEARSVRWRTLYFILHSMEKLGNDLYTERDRYVSRRSSSSFYHGWRTSSLKARGCEAEGKDKGSSIDAQLFVEITPKNVYKPCLFISSVWTS